MSGWLAIALVVGGLVAVAVIVLAADIARGDIGAGRHTMARAQRLLVVATDHETASRADSWVVDQRSERPDLQCFVLVESDGQELFMAVQDVIAREHPDAIVMVRHEEERHAVIGGTYDRLKEQLSMPMDTIYVPAGAKR